MSLISERIKDSKREAYVKANSMKIAVTNNQMSDIEKAAFDLGFHYGVEAGGVIMAEQLRKV